MTATGLPRLDSSSLFEHAPNDAPTYRRNQHPSIVHLGVGAFARAHLGTYADDLLRAGHSAMIRGVSLKSHRAEETLGPQDYLYTVTEREPAMPPTPKVIGSFASVTTGADAAVTTIANPATMLVTVTVTEKAYITDQEGSPTLPDTGVDRGVARVVAAGLSARDRRLPAPCVAPLDNVPHNGALLRQLVLDATDDRDAARWIADEVQFANSVVDRMVPAAGPDDRADVAARLGLVDNAAVTCEHHRSWYIDTDLPIPFTDVGVEIVGDIEPLQRRKLWLLNGPHSAFAYCGLLYGHDTIADATSDTDVSRFVRAVIDDIVEVIDLPPTLDARSFADDAMRRFANPALAHRCRQVAGDGSQKLPQRILPVVRRRHAAGLPNDRLAIIVAIWVAAVTGLHTRGAQLGTLDDPLTDVLTRRAATAAADELIRVAFGDEVSVAFSGDVAAAVEQLRRHGPSALELRR